MEGVGTVVAAMAEVDILPDSLAVDSPVAFLHTVDFLEVEVFRAAGLLESIEGLAAEHTVNMPRTTVPGAIVAGSTGVMFRASIIEGTIIQEAITEGIQDTITADMLRMVPPSDFSLAE